MTVRSTVPAASAGEVAVIWVSLSTVKLWAGVLPKSTAVAPVKPMPVIVTVVPPAAGPEDGLTPVTVGASASAAAGDTSIAARTIERSTSDEKPRLPARNSASLHANAFNTNPSSMSLRPAPRFEGTATIRRGAAVGLQPPRGAYPC